MKKFFLAAATLALGGAASAQTAFINPVPGPAGGNLYIITRPPSIFVNPTNGGSSAWARSYGPTSSNPTGGGYSMRVPNQRLIEHGW